MTSTPAVQTPVSQVVMAAATQNGESLASSETETVLGFGYVIATRPMGIETPSRGNATQLRVRYLVIGDC